MPTVLGIILLSPEDTRAHTASAQGHPLYGDKMPPCGHRGQLIINSHFKAKATEAWSASEIGSKAPSL